MLCAKKEKLNFMDNFTVEAKYKINGELKTKVIKLLAIDKKHAIHLATIQIQSFVTDRDTSSFADAEIPVNEIISIIPIKG